MNWHSAKLIPLSVIDELLAGVGFREDRWEVDGLSGCLLPAGSQTPFREHVRTTSPVDRISSTSSEAYPSGCIEFNQGVGLWMSILFADTAAKERWDAPVRAAFRLLADSGFGGERSAAFFASHGLTDPEALAKVRARSNYYAGMVPRVPDAYRRLTDGLAVEIGGRRWRCIVGYGHAPEHMALHCEDLGVLISGDMVLPRISTNVSVHDVEPEADSLALFLASLRHFDALPAETLVLPSHGKPFTGLHTRTRQLHQHHDERLAEVRTACAERPCHAADLLPVLFKRKLDLHQTTFAIGESIAHLHALWHAGELEREADADGVWRFRAV